MSERLCRGLQILVGGFDSRSCLHFLPFTSLPTPLYINHMSNMYHIWADGSYRQETRRLGAGWVIRSPKLAQEEKYHAFPVLRGDFKLGSSIAEIMALTCALKDIPSAACVHLHMDCANVVEWMKSGNISSVKARSSRILMNAFHTARMQAGRMQEFDITLVTGKQNPYLETAHRLSRRASSLNIT